MTRLLILVLVGACAMVAADPDPASKDVLAAMDAMQQAMIHRDGPALDRLLTDDLMYVHSAGLVETKSHLMKAIVSGSSIIEKLEFTNTTVRIYGNTALVHGRVDLWHSATNLVPMDVLHVWIRDAAGHWRLASRQATRLAK
ncbi:MAG TPA: nuclear transport factor 2 family protein [Bryobacteraceae bacterium]|nr:nuclear transport factor 2 family protein [Bryobacteraceae bacterium]